MAYQFAGFFVKEFQISQELFLCLPYQVRKVISPFFGSAISIPKYLTHEPSVLEIKEIANQIGLTTEREWIFIIYECWAGCIDYLFGYLNKKGNTSGSIIESSSSKLENAYIFFMEEFGISKDLALNFAPFKRGFWENNRLKFDSDYPSS